MVMWKKKMEVTWNFLMSEYDNSSCIKNVTYLELAKQKSFLLDSTMRNSLVRTKINELKKQF